MLDILSIVIPALLPPIADGLKRLTSKWFGRSVDEEIKIMQAESEKIRALAEIDKPSDNISPWVANLRASARYIVVYLVLGTACILSIVGFIYAPQLRGSILEAYFKIASACVFFLFGDRVYINLISKK